MEARRATADDIDELIRLRQVMLESMAEPHRHLRRLGGTVRRGVQTGIADGSVIAFVVDAPDGEGLAACGVATVAARLPGPGNLTGHNGYVQSMATDERWRRRGYGRAVFGALVGWCEDEGVTAIDLHATGDGEQLYRSFGFRENQALELRWRARWSLAGSDDQLR